MSRMSSIIEELNDISEKKFYISKVPDANKHGNCYEIALKKMMEFYTNGVKNIKLVHGVVTGQGNIEGIEYGHAWIELNGTVFDFSNNREIVMSKKKYYELGNIKITKEYSYDDMLKQITKHETYGPWDKVFNKYP